jgi:WD40 repeat protein
VAFAADGQTLLTGGDDGKVRFWEVPAGRLLPRKVQLPEGLVVRRFGPDARTCLAEGRQGQGWRVELWDLEADKAINHLAAGESVLSAAFSPDGRHLAVAAKTPVGQAMLWDTTTGKQTKILTGGDAEPVTSLAFTPDGRQLLALRHFGRMPWLWDIGTGKVTRPLPPQPLPVVQLDCDRQGRVLVALDRGELRLWERQGETVRPLGVPLLTPADVSNLGFSPDGKMVLTTIEKQALLWDPLTGLRLGAPLEQEAAIRAAAFDPQGRLIATAGENKQVRLWPVPTPLRGTPKQIQCWVEAITRQHLELEPTEAILPLEDKEVVERYVRLRTELGRSPE